MNIPDYIKNRYWKDFLPPNVPLVTNIPEDMSLLDVFEKGAEFGDKVALDYYGREFTFKDMVLLTRRFASALHNLGVKKGDVVAIWLPNSPHFIFSYYGVLLLGATLTAISPLFIAREMTYQIQDSGAKYFILLDRFFHQTKKIQKDPKIEKMIIVNVEGKVPDIPETDRVVHFNTLIDQFPKPIDIPRPNVNPKEDIAVIQYTGGTTGLPKGACLSHRNIVANVYQLKPMIDYLKKEFLKGDILGISVLPWYHIYGQTCELATYPIVGGKSIVFATFDVPRIFEVIKTHRPNGMAGVTTMFLTLLNHPLINDTDLSCLKFVNVGAGALPIELARKWKEITGYEMGEGYGLSEASPVVTASPPWAKKKYGSCGHPIPNTLVGVISVDTLEFLPIGEAGELVISGPQVMIGYHNRPKENEKVFFEAGGYKWLRTGDFARFDEEGYIFLLDRMKDLIKYKGHSVYPREVEEILFEHHAIQECSVIGVKDPVKGEDIKAFVLLKKEYKGKVTEQEIIDWAKENMAAYKYPRIVEIVRGLPKSAVGKILRRKLREKEEKKKKRRIIS